MAHPDPTPAPLTYDDTPAAWAARTRAVHALVDELGAAATFDARDRAAVDLVAYLALAAEADRPDDVTAWARLAAPALHAARARLLAGAR